LGPPNDSTGLISIILKLSPFAKEIGESLQNRHLSENARQSFSLKSSAGGKFPRRAGTVQKTLTGSIT